MSGIWTIMKKEFDRFFKDKRTVVTTLFLPGILIYAIYSFMGTGFTNLFAPDEDVVPTAYVVGMPESIRLLAETDEIADYFALYEIAPEAVDERKELIAERESSAIVVIFPENFDTQVLAFADRPPNVSAPNIEIYFNSVDPNSARAHWLMNQILDGYRTALVSVFTINAYTYMYADLATEEGVAATIISSILPMLLMMFLVSGVVGLAPESIAGEKERGTIATMLVTPLKRRDLALGKIFSLAALAFLSGIGSTIGMILALPNLIGGDADIRMDIYGVGDYAMIAIVVLSTMIFFTAVASILSAFAKSLKEAATYVGPLTIIVMVVSVGGMFLGLNDSPALFLIPLHSSAQSIGGIFALDYERINIVLTVVSNIVYACIGGFILTKMFNSEKVMFSK